MTAPTNFKTGISAPFANIPGLMCSTGQVFFVSNNPVPAPLGVKGLDGNFGKTTLQPLATITAALAKCVSGRGDIIYVGPGTYNENIVVSKDYIQIIGVMLPGYSRPDIVSTSGAAMTVHAQGVVLSHLRLAGAGIGGSGLVQQGNGFLIDDCVFESASNHSLRLLPDVDDDSFTASEGKILNSLFRDAGGSGLTFENPGPPAGVGVTDVLVQGCRFYENTGADILDVYTAGGNNQTYLDCIITDCQFSTKDKAVYIDLHNGTANAGLISDSWFANKTAALNSTQIHVAANIVASGLIDARGIVDAHTF